jgi:hypothetical protein
MVMHYDIENQTDEICKIAVQQDSDALQYIKKYKYTKCICEENGNHSCGIKN